jgi:LacI family transcriptional regulator
MPPQKRATSFDVAKKAGVSRTTVSFVLNNVTDVSISETTRQRVLDAARELKYHPDAIGRKLVSGKSYTLGLVLRQSPDQVFADALISQVILGVEHAASQKLFHVLLKPIEPGDTSGYKSLIQENHVDGIILSGPRKDDEEFIRLSHEGIPVILMGQLPESGIPFVDIDAIKGAKMAVEHLVAMGHKRIAMITNAPLTYTSAEQRHEGYRQALIEAGIPYDESYLCEGDYTPASGHSAMQKLLNLPKPPSAVFVASDVVALGALLAIKQARLQVPKEMAIVGFDDIPLANYFDPPLTTIRLPAYGLGWAAGERLIRLIQNDGLDQEGILLEPELIVRNSSS